MFVFAFALLALSCSSSLSLSRFAINNCHNWFRQSTQHFTVCCSWQQNSAAACSQRQQLLSSILLHFWPIKETGQIFDLFAPCSVHLKGCQIKVLSKSNKSRQKEKERGRVREAEQHFSNPFGSLCIYPCGICWRSSHLQQQQQQQSNS